MAILTKKMAAWLPRKQGNHSRMLAHYVAHLTCSCIECEKIYRYKTFIPAICVTGEAVDISIYIPVAQLVTV